MFEKNMKISYLLDFYGEALDEHVRSVMDAYYSDDLSLSEIAEGEGISRQGVRHLIKKGEEHLTFLEGKLGLARHHDEIKEAVPSLIEVANALKSGTIDPAIAAEKIIEVANTVLSKGV